MSRERHTLRSLALILGIVLIVMMFSTGRLTAGYPGWGDDTAAYMNEGIAIAEGRFREQTEINYYYHPSPLPLEAENGHLVYAWGYPLQLAVVNRFAGFDREQFSSLIWYKIPNVLCESVLAVSSFFFFRRRFSRGLTTALTLMLCLNNEFLQWINITGPDLWLMTVGVAAFLTLECYLDVLSEKESISAKKNTNIRKAILALLYGTLLWYAHELRLNGTTIALTCLLGHGIFIKRCPDMRQKRQVSWHMMPYLVMVILSCITEHILAPATGNTSDFSKGSISLFLEHIYYQTRAVFYFLQIYLEWYQMSL